MVALAVNVVEKVEPLPVLGEPPGTDHSKSTPETESTEKVVRLPAHAAIPCTGEGCAGSCEMFTGNEAVALVPHAFVEKTCTVPAELPMVTVMVLPVLVT